MFATLLLLSQQAMPRAVRATAMPRAVRATAPLLSSAGRELKWTAATTVAEPCEAQLATYLTTAAGEDLVIRLDDSVASFVSPSAGRIDARMHPLKLPGLTVTPTAVIAVDITTAGLRYKTKSLSLAYKGAFDQQLSKLQPNISAVSELQASDGMLKMSTEFLLTVPLPQWWPVPDAVTSGGNVLIRDILQKDTRNAITRVKTEYSAWRRKTVLSAGKK